jgi:TolB-like protein/Tfp pilus assembly protein PilF
VDSDIPAPLGEIVARTLEKDQKKRYQTTDEFLDDLKFISEGIVPDEIQARMRRAEFRKRKKTLLVVTTPVLIAILVVLLVLFSGKSERIDSIAVIPLKNLTGDAEQEYFVDGITNELIGQLGQISGLQRVISRTSIMQYKNTDKSLPEIARELKVDALVEGTVYQVGENVSIRLQLFDALPEERSLWTQRYDRPLTDVLVMYGDMASAIAENIKVKLTAQEETRLSGARQVNPEAYKAYIRGSYKWMNFMTPEDLDTAEKYFDLALEKDPSYAPAYAGLAYVWIIRNQWSWSKPEEAGPKAKAAALRAIELDENSAGAHEALAVVRKMIDWDWDGAWKSYRKTIELNPNVASAQGSYALFLMTMGHGQEALIHSQRAVGLDPFNPLLHSWHAFVLYSQRRYDQAIVAAREALRIQPDYPIATNTLWFILHEKKGMKREAFQAAKDYARVTYNDPRIEAALDEGYAGGGYFEAMKRGAEALIARLTETFCLPGDIAMFYTMAGENDKALDWLEKGLKIHDPTLPYLGMPCDDGIRSDPRFQDILRRMNLPTGKKNDR